MSDISLPPTRPPGDYGWGAPAPQQAGLEPTTPHVRVDSLENWASPASVPGDGAEVPKVFFRVESGNLTAEEAAALTVVLAAAASGGEEEPPKPASGWASPSRRMRSIGHAGAGGWRAEYQPR